MTVKLQTLSALDSQVKVLTFEQVARGWWGRTEVVPGSADPTFSAAIDATGRRFEVVSRPILGKLDVLARTCKGGGLV